jgi:hypothetical protein
MKGWSQNRSQWKFRIWRLSRSAARCEAISVAGLLRPSVMAAMVPPWRPDSSRLLNADGITQASVGQPITEVSVASGETQAAVPRIATDSIRDLLDAPLRMFGVVARGHHRTATRTAKRRRLGSKRASRRSCVPWTRSGRLEKKDDFAISQSSDQTRTRQPTGKSH